MASLGSAWRDGDVRPTHQAQRKQPRHWRTRKDPFEAAWPLLQQWLQAEPDQTAKALLLRLQHAHPQQFGDQQLRTLQRRVKTWRRQMAQRLVFAVTDGHLDNAPAAESVGA